jgi:RNA polymerase sigma factor (TIGR02999 family)
MDLDADITELAQRWSDGDEAALERLIDITYPRLQQLARSQLRGAGAHATINPTALVHEAYLKFGQGPQGPWPSRAHFFAFCATVMRRILVDYARSREAQKRDGSRVRIPLSDINASADQRALDEQVVSVLAVEEALEFLSKRDERMARVVECRCFGGLTIPETAEALGASPRTVVREWTRARAYLHHLVRPQGSSPETP